MRQIPHFLREHEPLQDGPARRIQTVAAHFLARKFFPVEHQGLQTGHRAKSGATRSGWPAAYDCNVENHWSNECWSDGMMDQVAARSITPLLHYSITPSLQPRMSAGARLNQRGH